MPGQAIVYKQPEVAHDATRGSPKQPAQTLVNFATKLLDVPLAAVTTWLKTAHPPTKTSDSLHAALPPFSCVLAPIALLCVWSVPAYMYVQQADTLTKQVAVCLNRWERCAAPLTDT